MKKFLCTICACLMLFTVSYAEGNWSKDQLLEFYNSKTFQESLKNSISKSIAGKLVPEKSSAKPGEFSIAAIASEEDATEAIYAQIFGLIGDAINDGNFTFAAIEAYVQANLSEIEVTGYEVISVDFLIEVLEDGGIKFSFDAVINAIPLSDGIPYLLILGFLFACYKLIERKREVAIA